ncbi:NUDIX hydrolase protein [Rhizobium phage RHph_TM39]|uniref:NUDIX hydrolase protein n=1 Tax=Rhizobium phage RHph_Y65 TaxID=2509785 RepID=A0A7S5UXQ4_9CAUD|nr:MutT/NUDIX hydrolase [Rhizobium phage RHph_Y65]QIG71652.1 NUDIX hydrolase protein [Rhizobium phage RHph_TM40]QIG72015.1 NUDIX hydrolase protein [Rhizobium phage RHph_TM2_3B]QIG72378.1 NUDIX hydrolase protein [Rhizobium phage RHph_TM3_3_6]QIG77169.1 NUDIX hydrolase protein [Rhizobium phage RHph_TM39]QIG77768.1 NUDIX hydrolase protein [Rhizobium phage RHph_TM61]
MTKVAIAGVIVKDGREILLGKRIGGIIDGFYVLPGGKLEDDESLQECLKREILEETNLELKNISTHIAYREPDIKGFRFLMIYFRADVVDESLLQNTEPDKCEGWGWYDIHDLPTPCWDLDPIKQFYPSAIIKRAI